jgi:hypothetical protein
MPKTNTFRREEIADSGVADLVPRFRGRTVLVLGDVMLDRYVARVPVDGRGRWRSPATAKQVCPGVIPGGFKLVSAP